MGSSEFVLYGQISDLRTWKLLIITSKPKGSDMTKNGMRPIHPGEVLREEFLAPLGMTPRALSKALHVTPSRVTDIVRERRGVTADTALRLARYFGGDAHSWLNLQQSYDLKIATAATMQKIIEQVEPRVFHQPPDNQTSAA